MIRARTQPSDFIWRCLTALLLLLCFLCRTIVVTWPVHRLAGLLQQLGFVCSGSSSIVSACDDIDTNPSTLALAMTSSVSPRSGRRLFFHSAFLLFLQLSWKFSHFTLAVFLLCFVLSQRCYSFDICSLLSLFISISKLYIGRSLCKILARRRLNAVHLVARNVEERQRFEIITERILQ